MSSVTLLHLEETFTIPVAQAINKFSLFENNLRLALSPYRVQSLVSLSIFREFLSALEGNPINITDTNFTELHRLCKEFGFDELSAKLSKFSSLSKDSQERQFTNPLSRIRSALLSESFQFVVNERIIESDLTEATALFPAIQEQLSVDGCARTFFVKDNKIEVSDIHSLQLLFSGESISIGRSQELLSGFLGNVSLERLFLDCSKANIRMNLSELMIEKRIDLKSVDVSILSIEALDNLLLSESISIESEDALLRFIFKLGSNYRNLLRHIEIRFLSEDGFSLLEEDFGIPSESIWQCAVEQITHPLSPSLDSQIISDFPEIFAEFQKKRFSLLWRGSRDGFKAKEFHRRCDDHGNTLTVILDTKGNIFGGFTPVEWESRKWNNQMWEMNNCPKADPSGKTFLFTLINPYDIEARKFKLRSGWERYAIYCDEAQGPIFGVEADLTIRGNFGSTNSSFTRFFGNTYINDTGVGGPPEHCIFFTGSEYFQVKEIEVFEIAE